jgi:hypothetical protein
MTSLSTRLRLTPQSRYTSAKAAAAERDAPINRPWREN